MDGLVPMLNPWVIISNELVKLTWYNRGDPFMNSIDPFTIPYIYFYRSEEASKNAFPTDIFRNNYIFIYFDCSLTNLYSRGIGNHGARLSSPSSAEAIHVWSSSSSWSCCCSELNFQNLINTRRNDPQTLPSSLKIIKPAIVRGFSIRCSLWRRGATFGRNR